MAIPRPPRRSMCSRHRFASPRARLHRYSVAFRIVSLLILVTFLASCFGEETQQPTPSAIPTETTPIGQQPPTVVPPIQPTVEAAEADRLKSVQRLEIVPHDVHLVPGQPIIFSAVGRDAADEPVTAGGVQWRAQAVGSTSMVPMQQDGMFSSEVPGTYTIDATMGSHTARITVTVELEQNTVQPKAKAAIDDSAGGWNNIADVQRPVNHRGRVPAYARLGVLRSSLEAAANAGSGNYSLSVPVISLPGRGQDLNMALVYNAHVWSMVANSLRFDIDRDWPAPGWSLGFGSLVTLDAIKGFLLLDPDGTRHKLIRIHPNASCLDPNPPCQLHSTDGTLIDLEIARSQRNLKWAKAYYPDGTVVLYGAPIQPIRRWPGKLFPVRIIDPDGNYITIQYVNNEGPRLAQVVDTLGRVVSFHYDANQHLTAITAPGLNNSQRTVLRLHYSKKQVQDLWLIDAIYEPGTATGYWFGDSDSITDYGVIRKVSRRRGMTLNAPSLTEQGTIEPGSPTREQVYDFPWKSTPGELPRYTKMQDWWEHMDVPAVTTFYEVGNYQTTIIFPDKTRSVQSSIVPSEPCDGTFGEQTSTLLDSQGKMLRETKICWDIGWHEARRTRWLETTDELSQTTKVEYHYGSMYDQVVDVLEYDYDRTTLLRRTHFDYEAKPEYTSRHIFNLPTAVQIFAGGSNVPIARTEYTYDQQPLANTPGVIQHSRVYDPYAPSVWVDKSCSPECDNVPPGKPCNQVCISGHWARSVYNPQTDLRGHITEIRRFADAAAHSGMIVETRRYDITGNLVTASTACCEQTSFGYTPETQYAYPSAMTRGAANPASPVRVTSAFKYDFGTGLLLSSVDPNGRMNTNTYDPPSLRVKSLADSSGAVTSYDYIDQELAVTVAQRTRDNVLVGQETSWLNGHGHVCQVATLGADQNAANRLYKYDVMGRLQQQSRPYQAKPLLYFIGKERTESGKTEVHILNGSDNYQTFLPSTLTPFSTLGDDSAWKVALGDYNRDGIPDLYFIGKERTGTVKTEVHILNGADNFQTFLLSTPTPLPTLGHNSAWEVALGDYNRDGIPDLYFIGKEPKTVVNVLNGANNYKTFLTWPEGTRTPFSALGADSAWNVALGDYNRDGIPDLYFIGKERTGTVKTEVHVLNGADDFQSFLLHTPTPFSTLGHDSAWEILSSPRVHPCESKQPLQWSTTLYDALGRVSVAQDPDGSRTQFFYDEPGRPSGTSTLHGPTVRTRDPWGRERWTRADALGRLVEVGEPDPTQGGALANGTPLMTTYSYDMLGNLTQVDQGEQRRLFRYDSLGRLTHQQLPERRATLNDAGDVVGAGGRWSDVFFYDARSNLVRQSDARGVQTSYHYSGDPLNRLQGIRYDLSHVHDTATTIAAVPNVRFGYMPSGDITRVQRVIVDGVVIEQYEYDDFGRQASTTLTFADRPAHAFHEVMKYDEYDRLTDLFYPAAYGMAGTPIAHQQYLYSAGGTIDRVLLDNTPLATHFNYDAAGQVTDVQIGSALMEHYRYDPVTGRLQEQQVVDATGQRLLDLSYDYQQFVTATVPADTQSSSCFDLGPNPFEPTPGKEPKHPKPDTPQIEIVAHAGAGTTGRVTGVTDHLKGDILTAYSYDGVDRLQTTATYRNSKIGFRHYRYGWTERYGYDRYGNRTGIQTIVDTEGPRCPPSGEIDPVVPPPGTPESSRRTQSYDPQSNRITATGFMYDAAGNMTRSVDAAGQARRFEYDAAGRLARVLADDGTEIERYTYGASRQRLVTTRGGSNPQRTYTIWNGTAAIAEFTENASQSSPVWAWNAYYLGARLLATTFAGENGIVTQYHHPDRLGTGLITTAGSNNGQRQESMPFGATLSSAGSVTRKQFTSYDRSSATDLDYAINRFYDPQQGRFMQTDPLGMGAASISDPQSLNLYAYVQNNPINAIDPTGQIWVDRVEGVCTQEVTMEVGSSGNIVSTTFGEENCVFFHTWWDLPEGETLPYAGTGQPGRGGGGGRSSRPSLQEAIYRGLGGQGPFVPGPRPTTQLDILAAGMLAPTLIAFTGGSALELGLLDGGSVVLETVRDRLLAVARDPKLRNLINQMYRKNAQIGSGSTADAIRYELQTGQLLSPAGHLLKGQEMSTALTRLLGSGSLNEGDWQIARYILNDLQRALSGQ
jgi:RHS repeat-associated protein